MNDASLAEAACELGEILEHTGTQIVFAESCTGGMIAAALAAIPGISRWLCGSAVTYQEPTKTDWLRVAPADLLRHTAVSAEVTLAMAQGVLEITSHADLAVAVTGHLGPAAPPELDGKIFIAATWRGDSSPQTRRNTLAAVQRNPRQIEAATRVLRASINFIVDRNNPSSVSVV
jgi:nicotinamide-nucleotide amidase